MLVRVYYLIGFLGLNIGFLEGQEDSWERHLEAARKLHAQALYKDAKKEYQAALQEAEALGPEDVRLAKTWNNLATPQDRAATKTPSRCTGGPQPGERVLGPDSQDLASCWNNIAALTRSRAATPTPSRSIPLACHSREVPSARSLGLAVHLNNLGQLYISMGRYDESETLLRKALTVREELDRIIRTSLRCWEIWVYCSAPAQVFRGEQFFSRSLDPEKILGTTIPDCQQPQQSCRAIPSGRPRGGSGDSPQASAGDQREILGPIIRRWQTPSAIWRILHDSARYPEAEPLLRRAVRIYEKSLPPGSPRLAVAYNNLARLDQAVGNYVEAEAMFRRAGHR
jgi:tetratricopeptide (TPR) repeat protein